MTFAAPLTRRAALAFGAGLVAAPGRLLAGPKILRLIELFTSQGCSSCPPADALAGELADDPGLVVISFNVDYWDYLGWRDTLAKPEFSQRQYDYAKSRADGQVFTPQVVADGHVSVVGSDRAAVRNALQTLSGTARPVEMTMAMSGHDISIDIPAQAFKGPATLWLMGVARAVKQTIDRGENAGKAITYVNAVRNLVPAAMWSGEAFRGHWMRDAVMTADCTACVAVLQQDKTGPVLAVARV